MGLVWNFHSPPLFSLEMDGPPEHRQNDPEWSVYLGNGCFWHTQYDFVVAEQAVDGPFRGRGHRNITSLVGYAGGNFRSPSGTVCYHGSPTTDYSRLGHSEAVSVELDANVESAEAQLATIASVYFEHGFQATREGRQRLDPQDAGPEYRNIIGLPGGMDNVEWWPIIEAANVYRMPLVRGAGGPGSDSKDQYVVYVYDSREFPFFRAEGYHQFHANLVVGRPVPDEYLKDLKEAQAGLGRIDDPPRCSGNIPSEVMLLLILLFAIFVGSGCAWFYSLLHPRLWQCWQFFRNPETLPLDGSLPVS